MEEVVLAEVQAWYDERKSDARSSVVEAIVIKED